MDRLDISRHGKRTGISRRCLGIPRRAYAVIVTRRGGEPKNHGGAALAALRQAYERAASAAEQAEDPQSAYAHASELRDICDELVGHAATLRARMAYRIYRSEEMSLMDLAGRISVSKARADQFVRTAKEAESEEGEDRG